MAVILLVLACTDGGAERKDNASSDAETPSDSEVSPDSGDTAPEGRPELPEVPDATDENPGDGTVSFALQAGALTHEVSGVSTEGFGYNGLSPGPTLRARVGDVVTVQFSNGLAESTTVHWHGLSVPEEMDGVQWVQDPVAEGGAFTYVFSVERAGVYWYHPHVDVSHQVDLGLFGAFVVEDPGEPAGEVSRVIVFDAWGEEEEAEEAAEGNHHHLPPDPSEVVWRVNGAVDPVWTLPAGTRARAQLLNVSNTSYLSLTWPNARQVGGQQGLLAAETKVEGLLLPPGGRAEVEVDAGAGEVEVTTAMWTDAGGAAYGEPRRLLSVSTGDTPVSPLDFSFSNAVPTADPGWTDLVYTFQGGGDAGDWLINGESWPDVTPQVVEQGASVVVEARNLSETSHPFHLHGNRLQLLSTDGVPPERAVYADTLDVPIRSTLRMLLVAENPGEWALHCHILGHEDHGMMTVLRVE